MAGRVVYAPYLSHVTEMWRMRDEENIFIQNFDEITTEFEEFVRRLVQFLDKTITISDEQIEDLKAYYSKLTNNQIDIAVTNKLWKRKTDAMSTDTRSSEVNTVVAKWAQQAFDEFDLNLN